MLCNGCLAALALCSYKDCMDLDVLIVLSIMKVVNLDSCDGLTGLEHLWGALLGRWWIYAVIHLIAVRGPKYRESTFQGFQHRRQHALLA